MKRISRYHIPVLLAVSLSVISLVGCASRGEIETMQRQLDYLERSSSQTQNQLMSIDSLFRETVNKNVTYQADLKVALQEVLDQMDIINSRLTDMERRMNDLSERRGMTSQPIISNQPATMANTPGNKASQPATSESQGSGKPVDSGKQPATGSAGTVDEPGQQMTQVPQSSLPQIDKQKMFDNAFDDLRSGNYELAKMGFEEYIKQFPDTPITDDAQYWLAECYYGNGEYAKAIPYFEAVDKNYSESDKLPQALYKLGRSYEQTDQAARAIQVYERLIKDFPNTFEGERAVERIAELRDESR